MIYLIDCAYFIYALIIICQISEYQSNFFGLWILNIFSIVISFKNFGITCIISDICSLKWICYLDIHNILESAVMLVSLFMINPHTEIKNVNTFIDLTKMYFIIQIVWYSLSICVNMVLFPETPHITTPKKSDYGSV